MPVKALCDRTEMCKLRVTGKKEKNDADEGEQLEVWNGRQSFHLGVIIGDTTDTSFSEWYSLAVSNCHQLKKLSNSSHTEDEVSQHVTYLLFLGPRQVAAVCVPPTGLTGHHGAACLSDQYPCNAEGVQQHHRCLCPASNR